MAGGLLRRSGAAPRTATWTRLRHITLSYTFYPRRAAGSKPVAAAASLDDPRRNGARTTRRAEARDGSRTKWLRRTRTHHDYHLVNPSPWPLVGVDRRAFVAGASASSCACTSRQPAGSIAGRASLGVLYTMLGWWSDVIKEASEGDHTPVVAARPPLRHDPVHRLGGDVLRRLVLDLLRDRAVPARRHADRARSPFTGGALAAEGHRDRSTPCTCRWSTR